MSEPLRKQVLKKAIHYLDAYASGVAHVQERGQNHGKMIDHWLRFCGLDNPQNGDGYPYCAAFGVTCVGEALGFPKDYSLPEVRSLMREMGILPSASCEQIEEYAKRAGTWRPANYPEPQIGWIVLFAFGGNRQLANHFGFVEHRVGLKGKLTALKTIEANTSPTAVGDQRNPSNGGIFRKVRKMDRVLAYVAIP